MLEESKTLTSLHYYCGACGASFHITDLDGLKIENIAEQIREGTKCRTKQCMGYYTVTPYYEEDDDK